MHIVERVLVHKMPEGNIVFGFANLVSAKFLWEKGFAKWYLQKWMSENFAKNEQDFAKNVTQSELKRWQI